MARKTNITGIKKLSIGTTKNDKGNVLKRYCVNYKVEDKSICKSFYFGINQSQKAAFKSAINFMLENKLTEKTNQELMQVFNEYQHESLV